MPQTSYLDKNPIAFAGQLADISFKRVSTGINKQGAAIPFGVGLVRTANPGEYDLPNAVGDKIAGIAIHSHDVNLIGLQGAAAGAGIPDGGVFNVLEEGVVYVKVENAVAVGDDAFCRYAAGAGGTQLGAFRTGADTNTAAAVKGARFRTAAGAGGFAELEFSKLTNLS